MARTETDPRIRAAQRSGTDRPRRIGRRALVQLYAALLYNANLRGFVKGGIFTGGAKAVCVPGLNCYSCPGAVGACPLGAIQNALAASGHRTGWYVLGILLLFGASLGRTICGWLCPMGLIQEILHKVPTPKLRKNCVTRALSCLKYAVLAVFVVAIPLWYGLKHDLPVPGFCKYVCPAGTLEGAVGLLASPANDGLFSMLGLLFTRKAVILVAVGLACIFCYRAFCRFLCPLGAIYGLFNRIALTGVRVDAGRCNGCGACVRGCPMDVRRGGDRECISCGRCAALCDQGAIALKCGRVTLMDRESGGGGNCSRRRRIGMAAWGLALAALSAVLICVNVLQPSPADAPAVPGAVEAPAGTDGTPASDAPVGFEVGQQLEDFSCTLLDGGTFQLAEARGSVVFINLWATYCAPCVRELPYFDRLRRERPDVRVLAVHSALVIDDVAEYLSDKDWDIDFAVDGAEGALYRTVNGSATLPQTVVLNPRGEVVYNQVGSVTYEKLVSLLEAAEKPAE